jgi:glycosyltransferase involved in cell wall biosynthesis
MRSARILVVSNLYPPYYIGGYELGCQDVVDGLRRRGHDVEVLTSTYRATGRETEKQVSRSLAYDATWGEQGPPSKANIVQAEGNNQRVFRRLCRRFKPDLVYLWNLRHVSISPAFLAQRWHIPTCYFVSDDWLASWEIDAWYSYPRRDTPRTIGARLRKKLGAATLRARGLVTLRGTPSFHQVQFCSQYLKDFTLRAGKSVHDAEVIHWGVSLERFPFTSGTPPARKLLYVGQTVPHKGVHTAVRALHRLVAVGSSVPPSLTIAGGSRRPGDEKELRELVSSLGLEKHMHITGMISREQLPGLYQAHDILLFPSIWDEPFSISLLEGMASGLAVVGTATGGSKEVLRDQENALIFPPEDDALCASHVGRLIDDVALFQRIRHAARQAIEDRFSLEQMLDKIESSLDQCLLEQKP